MSNTDTNGGSLIRWIALCVLVCLVGIVDRDLWTPDEPRDAAISLEMANTGNWIVPHLAGQPFVEKPPLYFAASALFIKTFGPLVGSTGAVRLSTAFWGIATLFMTFLLARRLFDRKIALFSVMILATMEGFVENMHWIRVDAALVFFVVAALWAFAETYIGERPWFCVLGGLFTAGAFLTKGIVGPLFVGIGWLGLVIPWLRGRFSKVPSLEGCPPDGVGRSGTVLIPQHFIALIAFLIPAAAWMAMFYSTGGPQLWHEWFYENHFGRFTGTATELGHIRTGEPWYYLRTVAVYCLPWSLLVLVWVGRMISNMLTRQSPPIRKDDCMPDGRARSPSAPLSADEKQAVSAKPPYPECSSSHSGTTSRRSNLFLAVWAIGSLVFLTIPATKRDMYFTPVLAAFAIMSARVMADNIPKWCKWFFNCWLGVVIAALNVAAGSVIVALLFMCFGSGQLGPMAHFLGSFTARHAVAWFCLFTAFLMTTWRKRYEPVVVVAACTALLYIGLFSVAGKAVDIEKSMKKDYQSFAVKTAAIDRTKVASWNLDETTRACLYCYCDWTLPVVSASKTGSDEKERLRNIVAGKDREFEAVVVVRDREADLDSLLNVPYRVVADTWTGDRKHRRNICLVTSADTGSKP